LWPAVVGHDFRFYEEVRWWWVFEAKFACEVKICFKREVETEVGFQAEPIIGVCYVVVILVNNVDIPPYQMHLKMEDGGVCTVIQKDDFYKITVSYPYKMLSKKANPSPRCECKCTFLFPWQRLAPNETGWRTAEDVLVIKEKLVPEQ
jgi:hypothetical protein